MATKDIRHSHHTWFLHLVCSFCWLSSLPSQAQTQPVAAGNTAFALNLYSQFAATPGNLFFSPYSISTCFAMLYDGAAGNTESQMSQVFGFSTNQQEFASNYLALETELESDQQTNELQLNIADALWTQEGYSFLPSFLQTATNDFQAYLNQADFVDDADQAIDDINTWVAQQTQNKIQNILSPLDITDHTRLVLANAIYFLAPWSQPFSVTETTTQPFYLSTNTVVQVPLMQHGVVPFGINVQYAEGTNFQAVELPYGTNNRIFGNNSVFMLVLLPNQVDGLPQLEAQLSPAFLSNLLSQMELSDDVEIFLPRFALSSSFDLSLTLAQMGMPDAFGPNADFSGIDGTNNLYISTARHKAWVEVTESGTEAAAATVGVGGAPKGGFDSATEFVCNHPFLFLILDSQTDILFMGRVTNPASSGNSISPLSMVPSGNGLKITWPASLAKWTLRQYSDLTVTDWEPVIGISTDGTNNFVTISPTNTSLYYRLAPPALPYSIIP